MFEDSLLDYGGRSKTKKPFTVLVSFVFQSILIAIAVIIPLIYTEALPKHALMTFLVAPPPPPPPP
ncbi:MAG: energy transducer TonB, partial [Acidobacteria bacterium]|nr:energy transducer TonB [Acidobacteriota bacterium]